MGNPVHSRPGSIASPAIACLTAPTAPDPSTRLPNRPTESHRPGSRLSSPAYCPADPAPAPLPRTAISAPNDNQRPPPAPFIGIERGPSRPTALTPCSNPKAAPHRWIRAKRLWLIGLGHLGQAYAWTLGLLPYEDRSVVDVVLQDCDTIVKANSSTGMLSDVSSVGQKKTRVVAARVEALGFNTAITERRFDSATRRSVDEPGVALVGVDDPGPRRLLEGAGFDLIVDAGLGGGTQNYLDILMHSFPSGIKASNAWAERSESPATSLVGQPAYLDLHQQLSQATDLTDGEIRCGIIEVAGTSAGAAFVGCVAATFVFSEVLRFLAGGPRFEVLGVSLRSPHKPQVSNNTLEGAPANPGFVRGRILP